VWGETNGNTTDSAGVHGAASHANAFGVNAVNPNGVGGRSEGDGTQPDHNLANSILGGAATRPMWNNAATKLALLSDGGPSATDRYFLLSSILAQRTVPGALTLESGPWPHARTIRKIGTADKYSSFVIPALRNVSAHANLGSGDDVEEFEINERKFDYNIFSAVKGDPFYAWEHMLVEFASELGVLVKTSETVIDDTTVTLTADRNAAITVPTDYDYIGFCVPMYFENLSANIDTNDKFTISAGTVTPATGDVDFTISNNGSFDSGEMRVMLVNIAFPTTVGIKTNSGSSSVITGSHTVSPYYTVGNHGLTFTPAGGKVKDDYDVYGFSFWGHWEPQGGVGGAGTTARGSGFFVWPDDSGGNDVDFKYMAIGGASVSHKLGVNSYLLAIPKDQNRVE